MKELSLNILDITENSTKAGATLVKIELTESNERLTVTIIDNGIGMKEETLLSVANPFYTTRTTRKVGMGIPLFRLAAEMTGGRVELHSVVDDGKTDAHGTTITAYFYKNHIDFTPLGDIIETVVTLVQGNPDIDFIFTHKIKDKTISLDTKELNNILGDVPLNNIEVVLWIKEYLGEQYTNCNLT